MNTLPSEFLTYWCSLVERARNKRVAYRYLTMAWRNGDKIPGYPTPFTNLSRNRERLPRGWSYHNLLRRLPGKIERSFLRRASAHPWAKPEIERLAVGQN